MIYEAVYLPVLCTEMFTYDFSTKVLTNIRNQTHVKVFDNCRCFCQSHLVLRHRVQTGQGILDKV